MGIKRRILSVALIVIVLTGCTPSPEVSRETVDGKVQSLSQDTDMVEFPYSTTESPLILESLRCYSGPYWEDESGKTVENVPALMVCNPTSRMVEFASFAVEQEGRTLYFFVYDLPPQSRCLALEYTAQRGEGRTLSCREICVRWGHQELSRERLDYFGLDEEMTVINRDNREIDHVILRYKQYVKDGDYYLGGAVQTAHLFSLEAEERRTVWPLHYDAAHARIVGICIEE